MSPHEYLAAFRRYWPIVAATLLLGALGAYGLSSAATPQYTATTKLYFSPSFGSSATDLNQGSTYTQNQMLSFAELAKSPTVLRPVIDNLGLEVTPGALSNSITITTPQNTVILDAAVTHPSAAEAARIANALATSIVAAVKDIAPVSAEKDSAVSVNIIASASAPTRPSSPDTTRNLIAGVLIGLVVGILVVVLRERLDTRVRSAAILGALTRVPLLGTVSRSRKRAGDDRLGPLGPHAEDYRRLCAHLTPSGDSTGRLSLLVTSSIAGEDKSQVALGLAMAFSERGRRVLVVDGDVRMRQITKLVDLDSEPGLVNVLADSLDPDGAIHSREAGRIHVMPAGPLHQNPGGLLASADLPDVFDRLENRFDVLIIDAAPVNPTADASILGSSVDGAVLVVGSATVQRHQLAKALDSLEKSSVNVLGVVLSQVPKARTHEAYSARRPVPAPHATAPHSDSQATSAAGGTPVAQGTTTTVET